MTNYYHEKDRTRLQEIANEVQTQLKKPGNAAIRRGVHRLVSLPYAELVTVYVMLTGPTPSDALDPIEMVDRIIYRSRYLRIATPLNPAFTGGVSFRT